ncbi:Zn-dependent dipeptidase, microsomal dipeptidase [Jonquetella anthropi DSM 22815]|uniref:Zn-dependent dipeptidase, microsomal dipeptidase n=1 Tax=Jonquetella anthropi DSM 22815 TaxID=885272 RepID=H0UMP0_9BACT|nr:Zn-dependent dipeptidase, microsomal dipeptidase [Jonquetella anthropi DSM 22815]
MADAHFDLLALLAIERLEKGRSHVLRDDFLPEFRAGGVDLIVSSIFVENRYIPEMALRHALDQIACFHEELDECGGSVALCRSTDEIRRARAAGQVAVLLSFEGVDPLGTDLNLLRVFYELGVRGVGLVWSRRNAAADGAFFAPRPEGKKGGLTDWGVQLVKETQRLGMYLDVSHLNDEGFDDLAALGVPFLASHSNCRALTFTMRNLTDAQMTRLASAGGVMGTNCSSGFVIPSPDRLRRPTDPDWRNATPHELALHARHVKELIGSEHLCFGFDFCDRFAPAGQGHDALGGHTATPEFTVCLIDEGFTDGELQGVLGENLMSFLARTIG